MPLARPHLLTSTLIPYSGTAENFLEPLLPPVGVTPVSSIAFAAA